MLCLQMRVTLLSRGAQHTFPTIKAPAAWIEAPVHVHVRTRTHSHTRTDRRKQTDDESPLATRLGNLPDCQPIDRVAARETQLQQGGIKFGLPASSVLTVS